MSGGPQVIVIGAGITGLTCARTLHKLGLETLILESGTHVGGVIRTEKRDGYLLEWGPNSLLPTPHTFQLIDEIGLGSDLQQADPKAPRFVCVNGELRRVPFGALTAQGIARALAEPFVRSKATEDESVAHFFRRRLGPQVLDRLIGPLVTGIYAGDSEKLSVAATFPKLVEIERDHGSLIVGMIRTPRKKGTPQSNGSAQSPGNPRRSSISSFPDGMETLPKRLAEGLNIQLGSTGVRIGKTVQAPATIITTPAYNAAEIVENFNEDLASLLRQVTYAPIVLAATSLADDTLQIPVRGFGFLVPRSERLNVLGTIFNSSLFLDRAPKGYQLLTSFVGGALNPEAYDWPDGRVWDVVCSELKRVLKLQLQPSPVALLRHRRAIPQYGLNHLKWRRALNTELKRSPGLFITGNYLEGVSVPACMEQADKMAHTVAEYIRGRK